MSADNYSWTDRILGTSIHDYVVERLIGEGGMAAVFEATHIWNGSKVAIKVLRPEYTINANIRDKFRREAELMASLKDHLNIPTIEYFDEQPDRLSIIMELLKGEDLSKRIKRAGPLSNEEITEIFEQILSALLYAHEKGIVHRDIKPSNIYILADNEVRILDFGISKNFGEGDDGTKTGIQVGTLYYMSPEQVKGIRSIDHRSDIYSLGVTLYCAVKGRPPYDNKVSEFYINQKIVFEDFPDIDESTSFGHLIKKACKKDRELRFQTCAEWLEQFSYSPAVDIPQPEEDLKNDNSDPIYDPIFPEPGPPSQPWIKWLLIAGVCFIGVFAYWYFNRGVPPIEDPITDSTQVLTGTVDTSIIVSGTADTIVGNEIYYPPDTTIYEEETEQDIVYKNKEVDLQPSLEKEIKYNSAILQSDSYYGLEYVIEVKFIVEKNSIVNINRKLEFFDKSNSPISFDDFELVKNEIRNALNRTSKSYWLPAEKGSSKVSCEMSHYFTFKK